MGDMGEPLLGARSNCARAAVVPELSETKLDVAVNFSGVTVRPLSNQWAVTFG